MVCKSALATVQDAVPHRRYEHKKKTVIRTETALSLSTKFYDICQCAELRRVIDHPDFQSNTLFLFQLDTLFYFSYIFTIFFLQFSLHVSDRLVHHQENQITRAASGPFPSFVGISCVAVGSN